jgi:Rod binding domain-containing protein
MRISAPTGVYRDCSQTRAAKAAREFEAQLLNSLLDAGGDGLLGLPGPGSPESGSYNSLARESLSTALAAHGGIGLAAILVSALRSTKVAASPPRLPEIQPLPDFSSPVKH